MKSKYFTLVVIVAMALPGVLAALPSAQGLPGPVVGTDLLVEELGAGAELSHPSMLRLVVADFDPVLDGFDMPRGLRTTRWDGLFLVQFVGPMLPAWEQRVVGMGCDLISYIPDNGFIARMTVDARSDVVDLPFVRWVGPYHPGFRVDPQLWTSTDPVLGLAVASAQDPHATARAFEDLGGAMEAVGPKVVQGLLPRASLLSLARHGSVEWVEKWLEPELHNDNAARLVSARMGGDGPYSNLTRRMWSYNNGVFEGTTGYGYIVSAADTGLDPEHGSFPGHIPTRNYVGGPTNIDTYGHGTHVLGTAAGIGVPRPGDTGAATGKYIGVAPEANVFMQDIFDGFQFFRSFDVLGKEASEVGAVVNSNSWGEGRGGQYTTNELAYDTMVRDAEPGKPGEQGLMFCFSAGNSGGFGDGSVASPASGKNIITVGATGNDKRGVSGSTVAGFSSRGPTADGRVKPDVVASGQHVVSAAAKAPTTMPYDPPSDGGTRSWTYASGTSMSCPTVAGTVALVYDWCNSEWGHDPSPAMVKALLINGADKLAGAYPNTRQGWGRVNLTKLHDTPDYRTYFFDQETSLRVGVKDSHRYIFAVEPGQRTFKFTLVWTDYPGAPSGSKALVSDLDLVLIDPDGLVYKGNNFDGNGFSRPGDELSNDTVNTVEKVVVPQAKEGFWSVHVIARNTPRGAQDYVLIGQGDLQDKWRDLALQNVTLNKEEMDEGEPVVFSGDIVAMGNLPFSPFHYEVYLLEKDTGKRTVFEQGTRLLNAWESIHFSHRWFSVRGDWEFGVDVDTENANVEFSKLNNKLTLDRFVKGYGVEAELLPANVMVWPGLEAHLVVNVVNMGNVPDTFTLSTEGIPVGWEVALESESIRLDPSVTGTITFKVLPPEAAKAGEEYTLNVKVISSGNSTYWAGMETRSAVGQVHGVDSNLARQGSNVFPGHTVEHLVNITNTGNGLDTYNLAVYGLPAGWSVNMSEDSVTIEDNVTKTVSLELESPEQALSGTIADLEIVVTTSEGGSKTVKARTQVKQTTGMGATLWAEDTVRPGGTVDYFVEIFNLGNGPDVFWYEADAPNHGWTANFPFPVDGLALNAFETFNASGVLRCPGNARAGDYTFKVQITTREYLEELTAVVHVEEVYDASPVLVCTGSAIYPGNETMYCLEVTSLCNVPTDFVVGITGAPTDWEVLLDPGTASIDPFQAREFSITLGPPTTTPPGFYNLRIVMEYGPIEETFNVTLYVLEQVGSGDGGTDGGGEGPLAGGNLLIALVAVVVLVVIVLALVLRGGRRRRTELEFEEEVAMTSTGRPLPPPPPPEPRGRGRPLPPPPPPRRPETVEELLSDTPVMTRESHRLDRYSADAAYASGRTLAEAGTPTLVGECPACGGKVLEYPSGSLMCSSCGAQYTEE